MLQIPAAFTLAVLRGVQRLGRGASRAGGDAQARDGHAALEADLVEARLLASQWQSRLEASESRAAALEASLAASEMTTLDLRSRLVCLHGKLATTTATARYQTLASALDSQGSTSAVATAARAEPPQE